jgi:hypothetical protein
MERAQAYQAAWIEFIDAIDRINEIASAARRSCAAIFSEVGDLFPAASFAYHLGNGREREAAEEQIKKMVATARSAFAPPGMECIDIDDAPYIKAFMPRYNDEDFEWRTLNFATLWQSIEAKHGGKAGAAAGYSECANTLSTVFWLCRGDQVSMKAGRVILSCAIQVAGSSGDGRQLSYGSYEKVRSMLNALKTFMLWVDPKVSVSVFDQLLSERFNGWFSSYVRTRERLPLNERAKLVCYYTGIELHLEPALAQQLQLFLLEFSTRFNKEAA